MLAALVLWAGIEACKATAAEPSLELASWLSPQSWQRDAEGPIISLGKEGDFDDQHLFAPAVAHEGGRFHIWYSGSRGTPTNRVFCLGLATSGDGIQFEKHKTNPALAFADGKHSILTPAILRNADGSVLRENGKLRMWFSAATLGKGGLHRLHESTSDDGLHWSEPSPPLADNVYCPTVLKSGEGFEMWFSDVSRRPWVIRHATSADGRKWSASEQPVLQLSQDWEAEVLVYPTVLKVDGVYLMWYGSYYQAVRRETTAIGFAASLDGKNWHKHPQNPVLLPDPKRPWESNYVGSGSVLRLVDGSFRYWYASRKAPPFLNLYFAINTARWTGPQSLQALPLPPSRGDVGILDDAAIDARSGRSVIVLDVVDEDDAIVRAWYLPAAPAGAAAPEREPTFVDLWIHGIDTSTLAEKSPARLRHLFQVTGNQLFDTTCGKRSLPLLEPR